MATISRTGIAGGGTIQPAHITNIIDALDGTSATTTIVATGSFTGSLVGTLTGTATSATTATTATNATNTAVTNTSTGTGPYYITFVELATGNVAQRVDATGLTYNATTDTITATASFATTALSASYALNVPATASYALAALSSSYALTASYALNAGGGGGGIFALTGSTYATTNNLEITGSLKVTAGVTASLQGTASYAVGVGVVRTSTAATFYPTFVDSSNATTGSEQMYTAANITVAPDRGLLQATSISGSITGSILAQNSLRTSNGATTTLSGSLDGTVDGSSNLILNLADLSKSAGRGYFVMPIYQPGGPTAVGTCYLSMVDPPVLNVFDGSNWRTLTFT